MNLYPVITVILGDLPPITLPDMIITLVVCCQFDKRALETYFKNKNQGQFNTADALAP